MTQEAQNEQSGRCARCNRILKDKTSIGIGMGPKCARKAGITRRIAAVKAEPPMDGQLDLLEGQNVEGGNE